MRDIALSLVFLLLSTPAIWADNSRVTDMITQHDRPDHIRVYRHNMNMSFSAPPHGVATLSKGTIRDAWAAIAAVMPLVEDVGANVTWIPPKGVVRVAYGYSYSLPRDAAGCGSTYTLDSTGIGFSASVQAGGRRQQLDMRGGVANYSLNAPTGEEVEFDVTIVFRVRYVEHRRTLDCDCTTDSEGNTDCDCSCKYTGSEVHEDQLSIEDSESFHLYAPDHEETLVVDRRLRDAWQGRFAMNSTIPIDGVQLSLGASSFSFDVYDYQIVPTNFGMEKILATPRREAQKKVSGGVFSDLTAGPYDVAFYFTSGGLTPAEARVYTHFNEYETPLEPAWRTETTLELKTDRGQYKTEDTVRATAVLTDQAGRPIKGRRILFKYAGETREALTDQAGHATAVFKPVVGESIISARFPGDGEYGESYDTSHFFVGEYTFTDFLAAVAWATLLYYVTLKTAKLGLKLITGRHGW
jgi:hypothetical protein